MPWGTFGSLMKSGSIFNPAPNPGTCVCVCARARVSVRVNVFICTGNYSAREGVGGAAAKAPAGADASLTADDKDGDLPAKMECTICLCGMKKPAVTKCGSLSASIHGLCNCYPCFAGRFSLAPISHLRRGRSFVLQRMHPRLAQEWDQVSRAAS